MLVTLKEILTRNNSAIGAFNTPNLESIIAVISSAEELGVPVIISHAQLHESIMPLETIAPIMIDCAKRSSTKVCVHLDHGEDYDYVKRAIDLGFSSVMIDASTMEYEDNIALSKKVCYYAHAHNVSVEAELGRLKGREAGGIGDGTSCEDNGQYTNPQLVVDFINRTNIDALAIAFGTAHGIYDTPPVLNFDIISQVAQKTDIPLVMHGGSGIDSDGYKKAISLGISKINYYTYMAYDGYDAIVDYTKKQSRGFFHELSSVATAKMKETALATLKIFSNKT